MERRAEGPKSLENKEGNRSDGWTPAGHLRFGDPAEVLISV
jgi:hypothetical protein